MQKKAKHTLKVKKLNAAQNGPNKAAWHPKKLMIHNEEKNMKSKLHRKMTKGLVQKLNMSKCG